MLRCYSDDGKHKKLAGELGILLALPLWNLRTGRLRPAGVTTTPGTFRLHLSNQGGGGQRSEVRLHASGL